MSDGHAPVKRDGGESMAVEDQANDPVSGFMHRAAGLQATARALAGASPKRPPLAVLWLNMDRFRQVNDSFGYAGGDSVIGRVAERIRACVSRPCTLMRMGSDEFVVLVPELDRFAAQLVARALLLEIEQPMPIGDILIRPSASIGIALAHAERDPTGVLEQADRAMIEAKRQGGNRIVIAGDEAVAGRLGVQLARAELAIESALHSALASGGLELHYQPIIGQDGRVEALEALMRCTAHGVQIPPGKFIPVAEKTGLIVRLGEWSLLQGARTAALLRDRGHSTKIAINVSRVQLTSCSFMQSLHGALICADVAPQLIELELTESLFMDLSPTVQENIRCVRQAGVGLAIDDFGTGYSCLASLKDLPATKLKFDRAFIGVLPADPRAFAIVKAMTALARDLGMIVVAEGVETSAQLNACKAAGVDATQGFFNARPMSDDALSRWMKSRKQT